MHITLHIKSLYSFICLLKKILRNSYDFYVYCRQLLYAFMRIYFTFVCLPWKFPFFTSQRYERHVLICLMKHLKIFMRLYAYKNLMYFLIEFFYKKNMVLFQKDMSLDRSSSTLKAKHFTHMSMPSDFFFIIFKRTLVHVFARIYYMG